MSALVVCESLRGSTLRIAREVARGAATHLPVELLDAADAPAQVPPGVRLLVVGAPTHPYGLSHPVEHPDPPGPRVGAPAAGDGALRAWIGAVRVAPGTAVASFDTAGAGAGAGGSAARVALHLLRRRGLWAVSVPQRFTADGADGADGADVAAAVGVGHEEERAFAWGRLLGALAAAGAGRGRAHRHPGGRAAAGRRRTRAPSAAGGGR